MLLCGTFSYAAYYVYCSCCRSSSKQNKCNAKKRNDSIQSQHANHHACSSGGTPSSNTSACMSLIAACIVPLWRSMKCAVHVCLPPVGAVFLCVCRTTTKIHQLSHDCSRSHNVTCKQSKMLTTLAILVAPSPPAKHSSSLSVLSYSIMHL